MTTALPMEPDQDDDLGSPLTPPQPPARPYDFRRWTTPARVRVLTGSALLLVILLGLVAGRAVAGIRDGFQRIGHEAGPQVVATSNLYFALNDMDGQVANVLLVGSQQNLGVGRGQALKIYEQRRVQAVRDLQQAATVAGDDPVAARALRTVLDGFTRYQALASEAVLLDGQRPHPPARPSPAALQRYRQATDLMAGTVLPAAASLTRANAAALERTYGGKRSSALYAALWTVVLALLLLGVLIGLQVFVARRTHRLFNPLLILATTIVAVFSVAGANLFLSEAEHLRVAKKDAFDSVLALTQARALSYDANADESRYLVDPERAARYEAAFFRKSQQLAELTPAQLGTYDDLLGRVMQSYRDDNADVRFGGLYGRAFGNITFSGERELAERTLTAYQAYQRDDRKIRALARAGRLQDAVAFNTSYEPGNSNHDFDAYDKALQAFIELNHRHFTTSVRDGESTLANWDIVPPAATLAVVILTLAGVRPRLAEYRL